MHLWYRIIKQGEITLNMIRPCRANPRMSVCTALEGEFNYERTPLATPGMKLLMHKKPNKRSSWSCHGKFG